MPELPVGFYFSQMRLQDYLDCKRRFQLRYLLRQPWPANLIEPVDVFENHVEQGQQFHRLVHRFILGIPVEDLHRMANEPPLSEWWQNFLEYGLRQIPQIRIPEITVSSSFEGYRLVGKFDLLALDISGEILIVDWKTSKFIPQSSELRMRMQSRLYPFIVSQEGLAKYGFEKIQPDQISMRYWYAEAPGTPKEFAYSQTQFEDDKQYLRELINEIKGIDAEIFPLTDDQRKCRYCLYRSLCDRGIGAGLLEEYEQELEMLSDSSSVVDLDDIPEIEF
ncbi:MAG: PD-(D/E)XK nuclease family protein [Anaerolineales bacterium]